MVKIIFYNPFFAFPCFEKTSSDATDKSRMANSHEVFMIAGNVFCYSNPVDVILFYFSLWYKPLVKSIRLGKKAPRK